MATILIIDDEKAIRKTLTEILSFEGYKIDEAASGESVQKSQRSFTNLSLLNTDRQIYDFINRKAI